eukprot:173751-Rhodomonas_salina.1
MACHGILPATCSPHTLLMSCHVSSSVSLSTSCRPHASSPRMTPRTAARTHTMAWHGMHRREPHSQPPTPHPQPPPEHMRHCHSAAALARRRQPSVTNR